MHTKPYVTRFAALLCFMMLFLTLPVIANAQPETCPGSIRADDCTLFQSAFDHLESLESAFIRFEYESEIALGNIMSQNASGAGEGVVIFDDERRLQAIDLQITEGSSSIGGFAGMSGSQGAGSGVGRVIFLDGVAYFGTGPTMDDLTWQSVADMPPALLLSPILPTNYFRGQPGVESAWGRSADEVIDEELTLAIYESYYQTNSTFAEAFAQIGGMSGQNSSEAMMNTMFGGMMGMGFDAEFPSLAEYYGVVAADAETNEFRAFQIATSYQVDMANMVGQDMFSMFMGTTGSINSALSITFVEFNPSDVVEAPEDATPMNAGTASTVRSMAALGFYPMMSTYFSQGGSMTGMPSSGSASEGSASGGAPQSASAAVVERGVVELGQNINDALAAGEAHHWTLTAGENTQVTIQLNSSAFDAYLELYTADGAEVARNDDFNGLNSQIDVVLPAAGEYTVVVRGYRSNAEGAYSLSIETVEVEAPAPIVVGETTSGSLRSGTQDRWTFEGTAGQTITIRMDSAAFDTYLELYGPDGAEVARNDDFNGLNSQIDVTLPLAGSYTIVARGFSSSAAGSYELGLAAVGSSTTK